MKRKILRIRVLPAVLLLAVFVLSFQARAQVTIGSDKEPQVGALLDLKEYVPDANNTTTKKGMLLPRVKLTQADKLYPMFETAPGSGVANADYTSPGQQTDENARHTGLTVYNLDQCFANAAGMGGRGVYTWLGTEWQYLGEPTDVASLRQLVSSSLYGTAQANGDLRIDIPSGLDARGTLISPFELTVGHNPEAPVSLTSATTGLTGISDVIFTALPEWTPLTTGPTVHNLQATDMATGTAGVVTTADPWQTRQTVLTYTGRAVCGTTSGATVTLNQTNYAIVASTSNATGIPATTTIITAPLVFRSATVQTAQRVYIHSNVSWKAAPSPATAADLPSVLGTAYLTSGGTPAGAVRDNGTKVQPQFTYTIAAGGTGTKYKTVDMEFKDIDSRAKPLTITMMQCQGTPDMSGVTTTAADNADPDWQTNWGTNVVRHPAKPNPEYRQGVDPEYLKNIYEEFYSADFGTAGRWMTTNLAAYKYDGIKHSQNDGDNTNGEDGRTLTGPALNSGNARNVAYWIYPGENTTTGGINNTRYAENPFLGLLYTWDAATAGKGGTTGAGNIYNTSGGTNVNEEANMAETTTMEAGKQQRIQGICPAGWHLPSDYEWNRLEEHIYNHAEDYSAYTAEERQNFPNAGQWDPAWNTTTPSTRPSGASDGQGKAMKEICGVNVNGTTQNPDGASNRIDGNGFSVLLAGCSWLGGSMDYYGSRGYLWTSSSTTYNAANRWLRLLINNIAGVNKANLNDRLKFSVRCVKD